MKDYGCFIIFENAFLKAPGDDPGTGFFELAKVEVSADGTSRITLGYGVKRLQRR